MGAAEISQDAVESMNLGQMVIICHHSQQIGEVKKTYYEYHIDTEGRA